MLAADAAFRARRIRQHLIWSVILLVFAYGTNALHDYVAYLAQWRLVLEGAPPWSTDNAYGPLHLLLAPLLHIHRLAPKMFVAGSFALAAGLLLLRETEIRGTDQRALDPFRIALVFHPLVWSIAFRYGLNDALVVTLVIAAVLNRLDQRHVVAGIFIGLAALIKFYPLALALFFAIDGRRLRPQGIAAAALVFAAGMLAAYALYGPAVLTPLTFGATRHATLLSVLKSLAETPLPEWVQTITAFLTRWNTIVVIASVALTFTLSWWRRLSWLEAATVGALGIVMAYKVGHPQFNLLWVVLVATLPLLNTARADAIARAFFPMVVFMGAFHLLYEFKIALPVYRVIDGYVGYVFFAGGIATLIRVFSLPPLPGEAVRSGTGPATQTQPVTG